jgi:hypothetical protein
MQAVLALGEGVQEDTVQVLRTAGGFCFVAPDVAYRSHAHFSALLIEAEGTVLQHVIQVLHDLHNLAPPAVSSSTWTRYDCYLFGAACLQHILCDIVAVFERLLLLVHEAGTDVGDKQTWHARVWVARVADEMLRRIELALNTCVRTSVFVLNIDFTNQNQHAHEQLLLMATDCMRQTVQDEFRLRPPRPVSRDLRDVMLPSKASDIYHLFARNFVQLPETTVGLCADCTWMRPMYTCITKRRIEWEDICLALALVAHEMGIVSDTAILIRNEMLRPHWLRTGTVVYW